MSLIQPDLDNDFAPFDEAADKVTLDKGGAPQKLPKSARKVELDLDDAPFLEPEKTPLAAPPTRRRETPDSDEAPPGDQEQTEDKPRKRPRLLVVVPTVVAVLLAFTIVIYFYLDPREPEVPPPSRNYPHLVAFDPFYVEQHSADGLRFLQCRFAFPAGSEDLEHELLAKRLVIRDGLFFYLSRREPTFLNQEEESAALKRDLLTVVNQFLTSGQLDDVLIDEYVIR